MQVDDRRNALRRFGALLSVDNVAEADWQRFFAENPFVLSESLPLRIAEADIRPLGRPGRSEADFIFYPSDNTLPAPYGVIELKRPSTRILDLPRKNVLQLSRDAQTAYSQAVVYAKDLKRQVITRAGDLLAIGNKLHIFLILGLSDELFEKVTNELLHAQYEELLTPGVRLIPYDTLYELFKRRVPPPLHVLTPEPFWLFRHLPRIYYHRERLVRLPFEERASLFAGLVPDQHSSKITFRLANAGACVFCGDVQGAESLAPLEHTPAGPMQRFFLAMKGPFALD